MAEAMRLVEVTGPPRERGRAYGEATRAEVARSIAFYQEAFALHPGLAWPRVLERTRAWRDVTAATAPDLVAEMDGIAEGAGVTTGDILALNARGEVIRDRVEGCSSFALLSGSTGDGHVYAGQNWDWRAGTEATIVMLRIVQPPRPTVIMQVEAGQVGRHGASSAGVALNANGLDGRFDTPAGLPQPVLRRLILDSASVRDAMGVPFEVRPHIAANLLITGRHDVAVDLETTPVGHRWGHPRDGVLVHGNHYRYGVPPAIVDTYQPSSVDSLWRVPAVERGLARVRQAVDSAAVHRVVHETMSDHFGHPLGVCAHAAPADAATVRYKTIMSSLVDLTTGEYRVVRGNPCENDYELLPWNLYDGPGGAG